MWPIRSRSFHAENIFDESVGNAHYRLCFFNKGGNSLKSTISSRNPVNFTLWLRPCLTGYDGYRDVDSGCSSKDYVRCRGCAETVLGGNGIPEMASNRVYHSIFVIS